MVREAALNVISVLGNYYPEEYVTYVYILYINYYYICV